MIETLACGTPVIAFPEGAATEIMIDGEHGMLVANEAEMAGASRRVGSIDTQRCRASVAERYDVCMVAAAYEAVYRKAIEIGRRVNLCRLSPLGTGVAAGTFDGSSSAGSSRCCWSASPLAGGSQSDRR